MVGMDVDTGRLREGTKVEADRFAGGRPWMSVGGERVIGTWEGVGVGDMCGQEEMLSIGV